MRRSSRATISGSRPGSRSGRGVAGPSPLRLAHRGDFRRAPENSLAAFAAALANPRCDGLELDVRVSADGVPVINHDATLARVHGRPERVDELTASALGTIGIPTLAEVLALAGREPFLDVELKGDPGPAAVEVACRRAGAGARAGGRVVVRSRPRWTASAVLAAGLAALAQHATTSTRRPSQRRSRSAVAGWRSTGVRSTAVRSSAPRRPVWRWSPTPSVVGRRSTAWHVSAWWRSAWRRRRSTAERAAGPGRHPPAPDERGYRGER